MALKIVAYDPPLPGFPYLAIAFDVAAPVKVLRVEAHATLAEAEDAIVRMAGEFEGGAVAGTPDDPQAP